MGAAVIAGLIAAAAAIASALIGKSASDEARAQALRIYQENYARAQGLGIPDIDAQKLALHMLSQQARYQPQTFTETGSQNKDVQTEAMNQFRNQANQGGMDAMGRARLAQLQSQSAAQEQGQRGAILQNLRSRGIAAGGIGAAMTSNAQQSGANANYLGGLGVEAANEDRANQARAQAANIAGNLRSQDINLGEFNTNAINQGNLYNTQNAQRIADTNVGMRNAEQMYNSGLIQKNFENQAQKLALENGAGVQLAGQENNNANAIQAMWDQIAQGGFQVGNSLLNYGMKSQQGLADNSQGGVQVGRPSGAAELPSGLDGYNPSSGYDPNALAMSNGLVYRNGQWIVPGYGGAS